MKSLAEKFATVIERNTFYFFNSAFEERYEAHINALKEVLLFFKNEVETQGLTKTLVEKLLAERDNGLTALLALTGFSNESLKRLITLIRVVDDETLARLSLKAQWAQSSATGDLAEWNDDKIARLIKSNEHFRRGIVNLFFEGATVPFLAKTIPLFELKKLSIQKLKFDASALIDTIVRYKEKGSYSGKRENNPESVLATLINDLNLTYETGDLSELIENAPDTKRTMDFIIPNKRAPKVIVESSFLVTTSSGQGDKSKTEISVQALIRKHYPQTKFVGFIDGIGWYVRRQDLKRMVAAYSDVFTYHPSELERFAQFLKKEFKR